jgi:hypothetical protein
MQSMGTLVLHHDSAEYESENMVQMMLKLQLQPSHYAMLVGRWP